MYSQADFASLSPASLKRLIKGHTVRVQHGSGLQLSLSKAQMKKHMSSKKKNKGYNLTLDPYQMEMTGNGFFGDIGKAFKSGGKKLASALIHEGIPLASSTLGALAGSTLGGLATENPLGAMAGEQLGQELGQYGGTKLADYIGKRTGYGMMDMLKPLIPIAKKAVIAVGKEAGKRLLSKGLDYAEKKALDYGVKPEAVLETKAMIHQAAMNPKSLESVNPEMLLKEIVEGPLQMHPMFLKVQDKMKEMFGTGVSPIRRKKMIGGTALIDQPFTTRQAVNTTGAFFKDPAKTIGFGHGKLSDILKRASKPKLLGGTALIDQPFTTRQAVNTTGAFFKDPAKTIGFGNTYFGNPPRGLNGGTALIDRPFTVRQAVNTTGAFMKDPAKTIGFGQKRGGAAVPAGRY